MLSPVEFDNISFIRSRLADDGISFPSVKDFVSMTEQARPEFFNFFSFHGRVVFVRLSRSHKYQVVCRNFSVGAVLGVSPISVNRHSGDIVIQDTELYDLAFAWFKTSCKKVLENYG